MVWLVDARGLQGATGRRGVGRYIGGLLRGMRDAVPSARLEILVDRAAGPIAADVPEGIGRRTVGPGWGPALVRGLVAGPRWLAGAELWHATFLAPPRVPRGMPWVATIHDTIPLDHPRAFSWRTRAVFARSLSRAARACRVVAVSEATAERIVDRFGVSPGRIDVIPPPVAIDGFGDAEGPLPAGVDPPYAVHAGGFDPLKGVTDRLLPAFARLTAGAGPARDLTLVLIGPGGPGRAAARRAAADLGIASRVRFVGSLEDEVYRAVVAQASVLVVSSTVEGFGIPVVEALAAGVPVAVGPARAAREAAGPFGAASDGDDPAALARAVEVALSWGRDDDAVAARRRHAARFAPGVIARQLADCYRRAGAPLP